MIIVFRSRVPSEGNTTDKEIYMYDIATKTVNKLSGELSAAFVEAAEANADEESTPGEVASASNTIESKVTYANNAEDRFDQDDSASDFVETVSDLQTDASEQLESFMDIDGLTIQKDRSTLASNSGVSISTGYSKLERNQ